MTTDVQRAWAAGLFEGEGSIMLRQPYRSRTRTMPWLVLALQMTDEDVVRRFFGIVECGHVNVIDRRTRGDKMVWQWRAESRHAETVADLIAPHLGERRSARLAEVRAEIEAARWSPCEECRSVFRRPSGSVRRCDSCRESRRGLHRTRAGRQRLAALVAAER